MTEQTSIAYYDAIIIGAGFSGLYAAHKLKNNLGLKVLGLEKGNCSRPLPLAAEPVCVTRQHEA